MELLIRDMKDDDWAAVSRIYTQGLEAGTSTFETVCPDYPTWSANHLPDCRFVITTDGEVSGWCAISATSKRAVYRGVVEVSIYVDRSCRNRGIGRRLLQHLCAETEKRGYWSLYSSIFAINTASAKLHEACGFRRVGVREKIARNRFGEWQDVFIYERRNGIR